MESRISRSDFKVCAMSCMSCVMTCVFCVLPCDVWQLIFTHANERIYPVFMIRHIDSESLRAFKMLYGYKSSRMHLYESAMRIRLPASIRLQWIVQSSAKRGFWYSRFPGANYCFETTTYLEAQSETCMAIARTGEQCKRTHLQHATRMCDVHYARLPFSRKMNWG